MRKKDAIKDLKTYEKLFSRDFCLPSVEIWLRGECTNPKGWTDQKQPFLPYEIAQRSDDTVHFYYNLQGVEWACDLLLKLSRKDKNFIPKIEKTVLEKVSFIRSIYEKGEAIPLPKLKRFLREYEEGFPWFEAMWLFTENESQGKFTGLDLKNIQKLRVSTEKICGGSDTVIRKSLERLFPKLGHLSSVLRVAEILNGNIPSKDELEEREREYFFGNNKLIVGQNKEKVERIFKIHFKNDPAVKTRQLKGSTAYRGVVRGFVRRVMGHKQIGGFKEGEILISPMTIPDFIPAITKAAAIVTDEGGVLSHAAIVAREFKKPTVVGTTIATKRLQDGDIVEVNATEGKVTLICHAAIIANELKKPCVVGTHFATDLFKDGDYVEVDADKGIITLLNRRDKIHSPKTMTWNALFR